MSQFTTNLLPNVTKRRSLFKLNTQHKTTLNLGDLVPFYVQEIYPGDTHKVNLTQINRIASSFIKAPMDNLFLDTYFFFVPNRLVFDKWQEFMGENTESAWAQKTDIDLPQLQFVGVDNFTGSIADYMGIPTKGANGGRTLPKVSALPFRAYALIFNEWFRDQNNQDPIHIKKDSTVETFNNDEFGPNNYTGKVAKINKLHDYFTSCLPAPQKGDPVEISLTGSRQLDVYTGKEENKKAKASHETLQWDGITTGHGGLSPIPDRYARIGINLFNGQVNTLFDNNNGDNHTSSGAAQMTPLKPTNLYANLDALDAVSINDLRFAFQMQRLLERDARGGTRYTEILLNHFGVSSGDSRLQRPEFLGGNRNPIVINQVIQQSATLDPSLTPQGNIAGYSLSGGNSGFRKGFTEHGLVIGVMAIRQRHTYQQGIEKFWLREKRIDFYDPVFANIGEQPVKQTEIFAYQKADEKDNIFGYNEAWADLRFKPDRVSGQMRTSSDDSFDLWHFADNYANAPVISEEFIQETKIFLDRTISVTSKISHQFIMDIYLQNQAIRVLPTYSVPGKIDQN